MRITTKGRYALRALVNLALSGQERPIPIKIIAEEEGISPEFLEQIFFKLKKAGIINSVRGPGGGFILKQNPDEITAKAIFEAVGEGLQITPCADNGTHSGDCARADECLVHEVWQEASDYINGYFDDLTLRKIMNRTQEEAQEAERAEYPVGK
jgi:Rrf2 family iron-sulfur cluster assembly transcriptional regulator